MTKQNIKFFKMANGLEIYAISKKDIPMVTVLIAVKNGSFAETEKNNGLAHLYEHMFFKANEKIPSQPLFMRALDEMGVELGPNMNAYTSTESVRYFFTLHNQYLTRGIQFMADAVMTPKFLQDELERERKVVIGEFDRYEASPSDVFYQKSIMQRLFTDYFIRKNVIGTRSVILGASQEQMHEIQKRYYIPNNSALFIMGDFDEAQLKAALDQSFGGWKPGPDPFLVYPVPEHPPLETSKKFVESAPVQTVNIVMALQGPKLTKDDTSIIAFDLISHMLSFESSPFQKEMVHSGIATSASFSSWSQRWTSPLFIHTETTVENAQKAADTLQDLVARMAKGGFFSERDLQIAKNSVEVHSAYDREIGQQYALNLASVWTSTGSLDFYENYVENVKKITLADIDRALKDYVLDKPFVLGGLVPTGTNPLNFPGMEPMKALGISGATGAAATATNAIGTATNAVESQAATATNAIAAPASGKNSKAKSAPKAASKKPPKTLKATPASKAKPTEKKKPAPAAEPMTTQPPPQVKPEVTPEDSQPAETQP